MTQRVFTTNIVVRFRDLDAMGHVNNAVMFTYFEEGRKAFFQSQFSPASETDFPFILAHARCDYLLPVTLGHRPQLKMWIDDIGAKSFTIGYELVEGADPDTAFARGRSVQVCFDYRKKRSVPISEEWRSVLDRFLRR
jgi:acyl-CoA thioester hydrolase